MIEEVDEKEVHSSPRPHHKGVNLDPFSYGG